MQALDGSMADAAAATEELRLGKADRGTADEIREHLAELASSHGGTVGQLEGLQADAATSDASITASIAAQQARLEALEGAANSLEAAVPKKLEQEDVQGLREVVAELQATVGGLAATDQLAEAEQGLMQLRAAAEEAVSRLNGSEEAIAKASGELTRLGGDVEVLSGRVEGLQSARETADVQLAAAEVKIVGLEAGVGYSGKQVEGLNALLAEVRDELAEKAGCADVDRLRAEVEGVGEGMKALASAEDVQWLQGALGVVQGQVGDAVGKLREADKAAVESAGQVQAELRALQEEQKGFRTEAEQRLGGVEVQWKALEKDVSAMAQSSSAQVHNLGVCGVDSCGVLVLVGARVAGWLWRLMCDVWCQTLGWTIHDSMLDLAGERRVGDGCSIAFPRPLKGACGARAVYVHHVWLVDFVFLTVSVKPRGLHVCG